MKAFNKIQILALILFAVGCDSQQNKPVHKDNIEFARELVTFTPYATNPVFRGTGIDTWDSKIRERGFILHEDSLYKLWYTGYRNTGNTTRYLGYATSTDGKSWQRYPGNPIFNEKWTEDICIIKADGRYYMFAEGKDDIAHLLISTDGINWQEQGDLKIFTTDGKIIAGPFGTPAVWTENGKWFLFYERNDRGIWLAESTDRISWKNIQDEPVISKGPGNYDKGAVAANQVVKYRNNYYLYYHASADPMVSSTMWTTNVAMSTDLIHWDKYPGNPIVAGDHSSGILVPDGNAFRLYTMHPEVDLYLPVK